MACEFNTVILRLNEFAKTSKLICPVLMNLTAFAIANAAGFSINYFFNVFAFLPK